VYLCMGSAWMLCLTVLLAGWLSVLQSFFPLQRSESLMLSRPVNSGQGWFEKFEEWINVCLIFKISITGKIQVKVAVCTALFWFPLSLARQLTSCLVSHLPPPPLIFPSLTRFILSAQAVCLFKTLPSFLPVFLPFFFFLFSLWHGVVETPSLQSSSHAIKQTEGGSPFPSLLFAPVRPFFLNVRWAALSCLV